MKKQVELELQLDAFKRGIRQVNESLSRIDDGFRDISKSSSSAFAGALSHAKKLPDHVKILRAEYQQLNKEFRELKRRSPFPGQEKALSDITTKISNLAPRIDRVQKKFGKLGLEGTKLRQQVKLTANEVKRFGSESKIKEFNDELKKTEKLMRGLSTIRGGKDFAKMSDLEMKEYRKAVSGTYTELKKLRHEGNITEEQFDQLGKEINAADRRLKKFDRTTRRTTRSGREFSGILDTWWQRFGAVAIGFTVAYRAMNALENVLYETVEIFREAILASGELSALQAELAGYYTMTTGRLEDFAGALDRAAGNTAALAKVSTQSVSTIEELVTAYSELAQHGVFIGPEQMDEFAAFNDMLVQVAKSTGNTIKQIRSEWQGLLEGQMRATNAMLRMLKNIGVLSDEEVKKLKGVGDEAEIVRMILEKTGDAAKRVQEEMLKRNVTAAMRNWEAAMQQAIVTAQNLAAEGNNVGNIFGETVYKHIQKVNEAFYDLGNQQAFIVLLEKINWGLDKALSAVEGFVLGIARFAVVIENLKPELKLFVRYLLIAEGAMVGLKVTKLITNLFIRLNSTLIKTVKNFSLLISPITLGVGLVYGLVTAFRALAKIFNISISKWFTWFRDIWQDIKTAADDALTYLLEKFKAVARFLSKFDVSDTLAFGLNQLVPGFSMLDKLAEKAKEIEGIDITKNIDPLKDWVAELPEGLENFGKTFLEIIKSDFAAAKGVLSDFLSFANEKFKETMSALSETPDEWYGGLPSSVGPDSNEMEYLIASFDKLKEKSEEVDKKLKSRAASITKSLRTPFEVLQDEIGELRVLLRKGFIDETTFQRGLDRAYDKYFETLKKVDKLWENTRDNIQNSISKVLGDILKGELDDFEDYFRSFSHSLIDIWSQTVSQIAMDKLLSGEGLQGILGAFTKSGPDIEGALPGGAKPGGGLSGFGWLSAITAGAGLVSSLAGSLFGDDGPSYGDLLGEELRKMQEELAKNTEELRANTQAILSGEGRWTQASIRRGLREPLSADSVMRDRSLFENFALPVGMGATAGGGSMQFSEWRKSTGGAQTQNIMNQLLGAMQIDDFYDMMRDVAAGNVEEFIRKVSEAGGLAAEDMADIIAEFTEGADLERNREVARTVAAEMRNMFAEIENAAAKTASSMQDSLGPLGSWAGQISTWQSDVTEADRTMLEFNQQFGSLREELNRLRQIPGIDPQIISMYEEAIENAERLGIAIEEHFNQAARNVLQESARWLADLQGEISPLEQAIYDMNQQFDQYRKQLVENNASQEQLNRLSEQRAEAEEWLRKNLKDATKATNEFADALSAMEIRQRQAQIAGRSGQFQLQQIALDFNWYSKYGGIPGQAEIRRGIEWASRASPEELRAKATKFGITTEELLENVAMLDDALDNMGSSAEDAASASERAADALREQIDALNEQIQAVESIQSLLTNIRGGGDLAPVQSMEFFQRRYEQLLEEAMGGGTREVEAFTSFAQKYLEFMQGLPGYAGVASSVVGDLENLQEGIAGDKTLSDLYAQLDRTNDRLEYIRENTRETVTTMADAFTKALEEAIGTSEDKPWAENWNMSKWLSDFQSGMGTAIENWREDPSGFEVLKGFLGEGSGMDISQAVGGGWQAIFRGEGGSLIDRITFASPDEITAEMLWSLTQDNPQLREYWKNILYPGTDIPKYWIGAQHGATVSGPESGFNMPMEFHGTEHITPDSEMQDVKNLLSQISRQLAGGNKGPVHIHLNVGNEETAHWVWDAIRTNETVQDEVRRVA